MVDTLYIEEQRQMIQGWLVKTKEELKKWTSAFREQIYMAYKLQVYHPQKETSNHMLQAYYPNYISSLQN